MVMKPESLITKIIPVFDASCKICRAPSLNYCLFIGLKLTEHISVVLLQFKENAVGVKSDIRRAFLQIEMKKEDYNFLKYFRRMRKFKYFVTIELLLVLPTCIPYLLGVVLSSHLCLVSKYLRRTLKKVSK